MKEEEEHKGRIGKEEGTTAERGRKGGKLCLDMEGKLKAEGESRERERKLQ